MEVVDRHPVLVPLNDSALPYFPVADQVVFETVPVSVLPEASAVVVPDLLVEAEAGDQAGGAVLDTVTDTAPEVFWLPAASTRKGAVSVWEPFVAVLVSQLTSSTAPSCPRPPRWRRRVELHALATPTLSDAVADTGDPADGRAVVWGGDADTSARSCRRRRGAAGLAEDG